MDNDKATAIRAARAQLRAGGEVDSMNRVMGMVHSSKRTVRKYWDETEPEETANIHIRTVAAAPGLCESAQTTAPAPAPEYSLENLRQYYRDRSRSLWPQGNMPPLSAYPVLKQLWKECDDELAAADIARRRLQNQLGQLPSAAVDETPLRAEETRMSVALMMQNHITSALRFLERTAHDEGVTL